MPRRELKSGKQVADWLAELGASLKAHGNMTLIGSAALLWHAHDRGIISELPEGSMDVDPVTDSDEVAMLCYEALIGSEFERTHGWHVNLMPESVLREFPAGWEQRATRRQIGRLSLLVPAPADVLTPKLKRNEPRDRAHAEWANRVGLLG
jgi:hypothetical protein